MARQKSASDDLCMRDFGYNVIDIHEKTKSLRPAATTSLWGIEWVDDVALLRAHNSRQKKKRESLAAALKRLA